MGNNTLIVLKRTNKKPEAGDIFALSPEAGKFCFGKVIRTAVKSKDSFVNGMNLIYIYNYFADTMIPPVDIGSYKIGYIGIVNDQLWKKGYAENVSVSEVTIAELQENIAFWDIVHKEYVDITGEKYEKVLKYAGTYGLGSYGVVGREVQKMMRDYKSYER